VTSDIETLGTRGVNGRDHLHLSDALLLSATARSFCRNVDMFEDRSKSFVETRTIESPSRTIEINIDANGTLRTALKLYYEYSYEQSYYSSSSRNESLIHRRAFAASDLTVMPLYGYFLFIHTFYALSLPRRKRWRVTLRTHRTFRLISRSRFVKLVASRISSATRREESRQGRDDVASFRLCHYAGSLQVPSLSASDDTAAGGLVFPGDFFPEIGISSRRLPVTEGS